MFLTQLLGAWEVSEEELKPKRGFQEAFKKFLESLECEDPEARSAMTKSKRGALKQ
jgi:hypothetical protein